MNDTLTNLNKELGLFLLENKLEGETRQQIIDFVNRAYDIAYHIGYNNCLVEKECN